MEDQSLPKSYGERVQAPIYFPEEDELCRRLDDLYQASGVLLKSPPSSFFRGALYSFRYRDNPDWMAQVSHSLREILYQFDGLKGGFKKVLVDYGSPYDEQRLGQGVGVYQGLITNIAHHNMEKAEINAVIGGSKDKPITISPEVFEGIVYDFSKILHRALRRQIEAHEEIDKLISMGPNK